MTFTYSICYPNKEEIEYHNTPISDEEVLILANNYPWLVQLKLLETIEENEINYNPSLSFVASENGIRFTLTANYNKLKELEFSLWYERPKQVKQLFGILGSKNKMVVDEVWEIDFKKAITYLEYFTKGNYDAIEKLYQ